MRRVGLGAVGYLNARPLVFGLEESPRFDLRFDVPSQCAELLHANEIDVGMIPSIEYLRGSDRARPRDAGSDYLIVPDLAIASRGAVASVALYTTRAMRDVRSIALDTSSRTSVALVRVLCARAFNIDPRLAARRPDLEEMLSGSDAALLIGDNALFTAPEEVRVMHDPASGGPDEVRVEKIDLGEAWTALTGLPFVWAFWAGRPGVLTSGDVQILRDARDAGVTQPEAISRSYFPSSPARQLVGTRYLRDNIKYHLGDDERAGVELFHRYAAEARVVDVAQPLRFFPE
jgi:chorismate dehydratase